jgi:phosphomannomutase
MRRDDIVLGAEGMGGLSILGHVPEKDGVLACLLAAEIAAIEGKPLTSTLREVWDEFGEMRSRRLELRFADEERMRRVLDGLARTRRPTSRASRWWTSTRSTG